MNLFINLLSYSSYLPTQNGVHINIKLYVGTIYSQMGRIETSGWLKKKLVLFLLFLLFIIFYPAFIFMNFSRISKDFLFLFIF